MKKAILFVIGFFVLSSLAYAGNMTIVDEKYIEGIATGNTSIYDDTGMIYNQQDFINGTGNISRTIIIDPRDEELWNVVIENNETWSRDRSGISTQDVASVIKEAVGWLLGEHHTRDAAIEIGTELDRYFASDADTYYLLQRIENLENAVSMLSIRAEALEQTMEDIATDDYCKEKIEIMKKYNMTYVKCGKHSTHYYRVDPATHQGSEIISIETFDPNLPDPVKIDKLIIPENVFANQPFEFGIVITNNGTEFAMASLTLKLPETWTAEQPMASEILTGGETKTVYFTVTPGKESGSIRADAKFVVKGKSYTPSMLSDVIEVKSMPEIPEERTTESGTHITGGIISNLPDIESIKTKINDVVERSGKTISNLINSISFEKDLTNLNNQDIKTTTTILGELEGLGNIENIKNNLSNYIIHYLAFWNDDF